MTSRPPSPRAASIELDAEGRITDWSNEARRLFGWTADEAVDMPSYVLVPERNRARHETELRRMLQEPYGRTAAREITVVHRDGDEFRINAAVTRLHTALGD